MTTGDGEGGARPPAEARAEPRRDPPGIRARAAGFADLFERSSGNDVTPLTVVIERLDGPVHAVIGGRRTLMLGTNSYLGLNFDRTCIAAAAAALDESGAGSTASRVASGNHRLHVALEEEVAALYGRRDAIVFSTGFMANLGTIGALVREGDAILLDAHCHASIFDACRLSGATVTPFRHNDAGELERLLSSSTVPASRTLVVAEGLYSVLGDLADLLALVPAAKRHGATVLVDEAHSLGLFGARGRGVAEAQGVEAEVDVIVGTFSKSVGVIGGYCTTADPAFRQMRFAARAYLYTASLPPPVVAAARQALRLIGEGGERRDTVWRRAARLHDGLAAIGLPPLAPAGPVGAIRMPGIKVGLDMWRTLLAEGVYLNMLIPPATPNGEVVLRYSVSAAHSERDIDDALAVLERSKAAVGL